MRLVSRDQSSVAVPVLEMHIYYWLSSAKRSDLESMSRDQWFGLRVSTTLDSQYVFDFDRNLVYSNVNLVNGIYEVGRIPFNSWNSSIESLNEVCNKHAYKPILRQQFVDSFSTPGSNEGDEMIRYPGPSFEDARRIFNSSINDDLPEVPEGSKAPSGSLFDGDAFIKAIQD